MGRTQKEPKQRPSHSEGGAQSPAKLLDSAALAFCPYAGSPQVQRIQEIRSKYDRAAVRWPQPHVRLFWPFIPLQTVQERQGKLEAVLGSFPAFEFSFGNFEVLPGSAELRGDADRVYVGLLPSAKAATCCNELSQALLAAFPECRQQHTGTQRFHMTVGQFQRSEAEKLIEDWNAQGWQQLAWHCNTVSVLVRAGGDANFKEALVLQLGGEVAFEAHAGLGAPGKESDDSTAKKGLAETSRPSAMTLELEELPLVLWFHLLELLPLRDAVTLILALLGNAAFRDPVDTPLQGPELERIFVQNFGVALDINGRIEMTSQRLLAAAAASHRAVSKFCCLPARQNMGKPPLVSWCCGESSSSRLASMKDWESMRCGLGLNSAGVRLDSNRHPSILKHNHQKLLAINSTGLRLWDLSALKERPLSQQLQSPVTTADLHGSQLVTGGAMAMGDQRSSLAKGRVYVVYGPPASGKGTQCKKLAEKYGFVHLSTGDIFRELCERGTEMGLQAKEYMEKGCFIPDELVVSFIKARLGQEDVRECGCLLDGFPRTGDQAKALLSLVTVDGLFVLHVPEKILIRRASYRRVDPRTGEIYHLQYVPPPPEVEPHLVCRERDDEQSFRQRLDVFRGQSRRVLPYFSGQVWKVEATLEPDEVFESMVSFLERAASLGGTVAAQDEPRPGSACSICFDETANFLVVPCGHQCGCEECLTAVQATSGRCPICRVSIQAIQQVFVCCTGHEAQPTKLVPTVPGHGVQQDLQDKLDRHLLQRDEDEWSDDGEQVAVQAEGASLFIAPCEDVSSSGGEVDVAVRIDLPDSTERIPVDVCCVVDVSGSMGQMATYEAEDGAVKDDGLTVLDIVKHAVRSVVKALQDGDRLALVAFNEKAQTMLPLTEMTKAGQEAALRAVDELEDNGQTNIWAGLLAAMEALRCGNEGTSVPGRLRAVLLLTDGQPNVVPPRGHLAELRQYMDSHHGFSFQLNTFGFGYNLDSELLVDLAKTGNGTYAFIPDAIIVGTTFVNSVANVMSTFAQTSTVNLVPKAGAELLGPVSGAFDELEESWGRAITLGPLQKGQSRELVMRMKVPPGTAAYLDVILTHSTSSATGEAARVCTESSCRTRVPEAVLAQHRMDVVSTGYAAIELGTRNQGKQAGEILAELCRRLKVVSGDGQDARLSALKADVEGRMSKALKGKDRFNRWGKHYLRALVRSHQVQLCTNFMDPGLQPYAGTLFRELRDKGDKIFLSLPPPKPANPPQAAFRVSAGSISGGPASRAPSPDMNRYYAGAGGGCFAPSCSVTVVATGGRTLQVPLAKLHAGSLVQVADGGVAKVICVVRIVRDTSKDLIALPGGLHITARHPVRISGLWELPCLVKGALPVKSKAGCVYNLVLDRCHVLLVDGIECVTWGHDLRGAVVEHPFFGTSRILESLARLQGWQRGFVNVDGAIRDLSGTVVGIWAPRGAAA